MGLYTFKAPDIGEGTAEVELVAWHVAIGDVVEEDQPLADLMTEKATVEVPSPVAGRIVDLKRKPGEMAAVGSPLVIIETSAGQTGEDVTTPEASAAVATPPRSVATPVQTAPPPIAITAQPPTPDEKEKRRTVTRVPGAPVLASPAVRARAVALGVKLQFVDGTGPGGRVLAEDLDAFLASTPDSARPTARSLRSPDTRIDDIPIIGLRRRIAQQMQEAKRRIPHFSYIEEVDVTDLEVLRGQVNAARNEADPKLTLLPFLIVALVAGLRRFPQMNARFDDEAGVFRRYGGIHLGVATQTPNGLIVPVIRHAETLSLWALAAEIARLADVTRRGVATLDELSGSTITITSLGPLGGVSHTPVINHPEVAIIGPNRIIERPVIREDAVARRKIMNISSSFDHRVIDGWNAAEFIQFLKQRLEQPALLLMERS